MRISWYQEGWLRLHLGKILGKRGDGGMLGCYEVVMLRSMQHSGSLTFVVSPLVD